MKTPPPTANFASFRDNKISVYSVAWILAHYPKNLSLYLIGNDR